MSSNDILKTSVVGYLPVTPSSPTQLSTVCLLLKHSVELTDGLNQHDIVIVLDQTIYALARDVVCKRHEDFECVVLEWMSFMLL